MKMEDLRFAYSEISVGRMGEKREKMERLAE